LAMTSGESGLKRIYSKVAADSAEDLVFRNQALYELGLLYNEKCDLANAAECYEKVKTEALQFHLYDNYFRSAAKLMRIHSERMDFAEQERLQREALQVGVSLANFRRYQPILAYNKGIACLYQRDVVGAEAAFQKAQDVGAEILADAKTVASDRVEVQRWTLYARYGLAVVAKEQGRVAEALESLDLLDKEIQRINENSENIDLYELEASVGITQGHCLRDTGKLQEAVDRYWSIHRLLKLRKNWNHYYYVLLGLGRTHQLMGDHSKASTFFDLISDSIQNLELNSLKSTLQNYAAKSKERSSSTKLVLDRERKRVIEEKIGEIHFERRFVLLEILYLLAGKPGRIFSKEELVRDIWSENYNPIIHDSKVYTSISRLRKLLEPDFKHPRYILNERDGYAFNPTIQVVDMGDTKNFGNKPVASAHAQGAVQVSQ
jgi:DNA-binding winged helix-turn-helix (wHTH) protein